MARQFDGSVMAVRRMTPRAPGVAAMFSALDVLLVGADIADVREREGDDLAGIGGIGEDLLVAGHRGVEAHLADRVAGRAEAEAFEHGAVGEHQEGGGRRLGPAGIVLFVVMRRPR